MNKPYKKNKQQMMCNYLRTPAQWTKGLMWTRPQKQYTIFVFDKPRYAPIHNWFVFYAIDAYWIDASGKILTAVSKIKPFTCFVNHTGKARYLIETPAGLAKKTDILKLAKQIVLQEKVTTRVK
jgi:uncharacterized membrane protein (UPF0127 family)